MSENEQDQAEEKAKGPIGDAIKKKIAEIIEDPTDFIAFVKLLISLIPKKEEGPFSAAGEENQQVAELAELCQQAQD